jgi:NAD(P)-dependent dehydrogenase (short-subunit alcohol dehydrogenase family)
MAPTASWRLVVPSSAAADAGVWILALFVVIAVALFSLRYRISRHWIDLRTTPFPSNGTSDDNNHDMTVIITGGNTGLGYHVAHDLAVRRRFGTVVVGCRNVPQGRRAADDIARAAAGASCQSDATTSAVPPPRVECIPLDLASLGSVKEFARTVTSKYRNIYALVLNAGVWVPMDKEWKTTEGYEIHFGVNHLAHQLLAELLVPHMLQQQQQQQPGMLPSGSRVVWVVSSLLKYGQVHVEENGPNDFVRKGRRTSNDVAANDSDTKGERNDPSAAAASAAGARPAKAKTTSPSFAPTGYCDSKLMNALACRHLASALSLASSTSSSNSGTPGVTTYAVCPGFCRTDLGRHAGFSWWKKALLKPLFRVIQRPPHVGAQNIVYCCLERADQLVNGGLYRDGRVLREDGCTGLVDRLVHDGTADKLWSLCSALLKDYLAESSPSSAGEGKPPFL